MADLKVIRLKSDVIPSEAWDTFIMNSPQGGIFHLHGYASIIAPGWEALIVTEKEKWMAVLPFLPTSKFGFRRSLQPRFSQFWGVCFLPESKTSYESLSRKKAILDTLIPELAEIQQIIWHFSPAFEYPLPFFWNKFSLENRYTFQLDLSIPKESIHASMASTIRRYLRKGSSLNVEESTDPDILLRLLRLQQKNGHEIIGSNDKDWGTVSKLIQYLTSSGNGRMYVVKTTEGSVAAAGLFARFGGIGTYLLGTYDPGLNNRSAMPTMMWHAICAEQGAGMKIFDFEGSMIPGVERFFRRMGGRPVPYLKVERNELPYLLRWINELRS